MKRFWGILLIIMLALLSVSVVFAQSAQSPADICAAAFPASDPATRTYSEPEQVLEPGVDYRAVLCTETGAVYVDLFENFTPDTVNSFVFLAENGYFNNTTFHRVLQDFMAQGGDPTGTGTGGPGYYVKDEFVGFLHFDKLGWLAMANANQPDQGIVGTNGSQFFITTAETPWLDYRHTIFGEVLDGEDVVQGLKLRDPQNNPDFEGALLNTVVIVTDPSTVAVDVAPLESVDADMVAAGLDNIVARLNEHYGFPDDFGLSSTTTGVVSTSDVVATAPENEQEAYAAFLDEYHHQYRVSGTLDIANCEFLAYTTSYTLDAFDTSEDAAAALADGFLDTLPPAEGFSEAITSDNVPFAYFTEDATGCGEAAQRVLTHWQRGHFVVTAEATVPMQYQDAGDIILYEFMGGQIFEYLLTDVLRAEIR